MIYRIGSSQPLEAIERGLRESAARRQFGVIAVHDLKDTLKKKGVALEMECRVYEICNPVQARAVLEADGGVSSALPCRISVYGAEGGYTLATIPPVEMFKAFDLPQIEDTARAVENAIYAIMREAAGQPPESSAAWKTMQEKLEMKRQSGKSNNAPGKRKPASPKAPKPKAGATLASREKPQRSAGRSAAGRQGGGAAAQGAAPGNGGRAAGSRTGGRRTSANRSSKPPRRSGAAAGAIPTRTGRVTAAAPRPAATGARGRKKSAATTPARWRDEVGKSGIYPMSGPLPSGDAPLRGQMEFGQGERGAAGYFDSGGSELVYSGGQLLGGMSAGPGGAPESGARPASKKTPGRKSPRNPKINGSARPPATSKKPA